MAKLILTHEVTGLGAAGDVVEVKDGYARNFLLPRGFALTWTKGGEKQVETIKAARAARAHASVEAAQAQAQALSSKKVKLEVKAGESGRLFGTVKPADVAAAVEAAGLGAIDKRNVELPNHFKSVGSYTANVRLHEDVSAVIDLEVVASK
ncbi:50S ribosomal protein L9 [Paenarthrobacter ilicis]|uniref:Large ribosomal subunit protein bL9 n=1 Tax=Paenarthrobacter ilicis TaxID=43665 RepID=A0ABX0TPA3_9MICC|nr:50S ribosomal protein L9 [Paenarthrobacter ilicis]NIJ02656.1 large subunit ribosomal protein L9 [Paenarthrobacter ilicis]